MLRRCAKGKGGGEIAKKKKRRKTKTVFGDEEERDFIKFRSTR